MTVLVTYASRHGATTGIATRIADTLTANGRDAVCTPIEDVDQLEEYDAVVIGSAAYLFHWLKPAVRFVHEHAVVLQDKPVWLFSSGPLGTAEVDEHGKDVRETTRPREWAELVPLIRPRGDRVFFGAYHPALPAVGLGERVVRRLSAKSTTLPAGDFRDWGDVEAWAREIAAELAAYTKSA
jgi:menaquinone-dependent protoporphyrinogen oxidase